VLPLDLLQEVDVLALEARLERGDLLVGLHVLDGERDLGGRLLEERGIGLRVLAGGHAGHGQRADGDAPRDEGDDDEGPDAVGQGQVLGGELSLRRKVAAQQGTALLEHPSHVALVGGKLQADDEVRGGQGGLEDEEPEPVRLRVVEEDRRPVERDHAAESPGDGREERLLGEVRDDGIVDLKERAIAIHVRGRPSVRRRTLHEGAPGQPF